MVDETSMGSPQRRAHIHQRTSLTKKKNLPPTTAISSLRRVKTKITQTNNNRNHISIKQHHLVSKCGKRQKEEKSKTNTSAPENTITTTTTTEK